MFQLSASQSTSYITEWSKDNTISPRRRISHASTPTPSSSESPLTLSSSARDMPSLVLTASRSPSGPLAMDTSSMSTDPSTPPAWGRSISYTPAASKTSQYIDKITSENEKLKRELRAERLAREDEAKRVSAARSKAEESRAEHQSLQLLVDTNARALERKERKVEDLRAQLETESKRRKLAEQRAEEALKMLADTRSETQRQLAAAYEQKQLAETNSETAREGYKRLTDAYDKRLKYISDELNELRQQRREDADRIRRYAVVSEQLQHEMARTRRTEDQMKDMMGKYKQAQREEVDILVVEAEALRVALPAKEQLAADLIVEMEGTRDKMKWVMAQKRRQDHGS